MMKSLFRLCGLLAVSLFIHSSVALAQTAGTVSKIEIKHVGPPATADELIRANLRVKAGDTYVRSAVDDDVKNLYGTGFFYNIQAVDQPTPEGVVLTYVLQGKPRLTSITYQGNKRYNDAKLQKKIASKIGDPLDEQKLFNDSQAIKKMYQTAGYPQTEVKYSVSIDESAGTGTATFEVAETVKVKVSSLDFVGAQAFSESKLRKVAKIRKWEWLSWMTGGSAYKEDQLQEGKQRIIDFYREHGYIDFEITDVKLDYESPKKVHVTLTISEGGVYKLGAVTFKGNSLFPTEELANSLKMKVGDTFTPDGLKKNTEAVEDYYGGRGYIDVAESTGHLRVVRVPNVETGTMDLEYQIVEGQVSYIEKIEVRGNTKTKDKVIRRELAVTPGEVFDMTKVKLSKTRLENLSYFEKVDTHAEPTDVPNRKNLQVDVDEKSTGNLSVGAGFSTVDSIVGFVEVSQGNFDLFKPPTFTGGGQKFRARVQIGSVRKDLEISFVEPWFLGRKLAFGVDLYHHQLDFVSLDSLYNEQRTGVKLSLTRALGSDFLIGSVHTTMERVGITDVDSIAPPTIRREAGYSILSKFGAGLAYDTRNNSTLPTKGQRTELTGEIATRAMGGDKDFYKLGLKTAWYIQGPFTGHVLELVGRTGVASGLGSGGVPFYERYYLGGQYSLRGFDYRSVGPRELTGSGNNEPIGGNTMWMGSAEYSIPLIERLRFAMFYDIGNVVAGAYDLNLKNYSDNYGIGLRLNLPIGPLRLDYGIPINHDQFSSKSGKFQFGVGYTRDF